MIDRSAQTNAADVIIMAKSLYCVMQNFNEEQRRLHNKVKFYFVIIGITSFEIMKFSNVLPTSFIVLKVRNLVYGTHNYID